MKKNIKEYIEQFYSTPFYQFNMIDLCSSIGTLILLAIIIIIEFMPHSN